MPVAVQPQFQTQGQPWRALPVTYPAATPTAASPTTSPTAGISGRGWVVGAIGWGAIVIGVRTDTFDRPDSLTTINPASDGGTWTVYRDVWGINTNTGCRITVSATGNIEPWATNNGGPGNYRNVGVIGTGPTGSAAQTVKVDLKNQTGSPALEVFLNFDPTTCSGYWLDTAGGGSATFFRADDATAGSLVTLGTVALTTWFGTGNVLGNGITTVKIVHNGSGTFDFYQDIGSGLTHITTITDPGATLTGTEVLLATNASPNDAVHSNFDNFSVTNP